MRVKCEYCDSYIEDTVDKCPNCGAPNVHMARSANRIPKTIEELKSFCAAHNLNLKKMHFYIGENYNAPKAFGIYRDEEGCFVVYKNKADGSRAIRYRGTDEAYAVNEIYQKLKAEIAEVRANTANRPKVAATRTSTTSSRRTWWQKPGCAGWVLIVVIGIPLLLGMISALLQALGLYTPSPSNGYYQYKDNDYYYSSDGTWYQYVDDTWQETVVDSELYDNYSDFYTSGYYSGSGSGYTDYGNYYDYDNDYGYDYDNDNNWDDDWDDDDWDWDDDWDDYDWDSGSDWDSDW